MLKNKWILVVSANRTHELPKLSVVKENTTAGNERQMMSCPSPLDRHSLLTIAQGERRRLGARVVWWAFGRRAGAL